MKKYILTLIICTILSLTSVKATTKVVFNETSNGNINTTLGFDTGFVGGIDITLKIKGNVSYENFNLNNISNAKYSNVSYNKKDNTINIILLTGGVGTSHNLLDKNKNLNLGNLIVNASTKNDISYSLECTSLTVLDNSWKSSSITPELVDNSLTYKEEKEENPGSDNKPDENENNNDTDKDNNNSGNTENNNGNTSESKDNESSSNNGSSNQNNAGTNNNQNSSSNNNSSTSSNARPNNNASGNNGGSASNNAGSTNSSSKNDQDKDEDKDRDDEDKDEDEDDKKDEENTSKTPSNKPNNNTTITNGNTTSEEEEEKGTSVLKIIIPAVGIVALGALSYRFLKIKKKTPNDFDI